MLRLRLNNLIYYVSTGLVVVRSIMATPPEGADEEEAQRWQEYIHALHKEAAENAWFELQCDL